MQIEIVNSTRNIRIAPTKSSTDPMDQLRELAAHMPEFQSQAVEFRCDKAFWDTTGLEDRSFDGIPIIVHGDDGQPIPPSQED